MADKTLNVRLSQKIDTTANWELNNPVLLGGEIGVEKKTVGENTAYLVKVGNGTDNWKTLPYVQAPAADVAAWAKAAEKPVYKAEEITGLEQFIAGEIQDTDTQYTIRKVNDYKYQLQSKAVGDATFSDVPDAVIEIVDKTADITALQNLVGTTAVATQIQNAIAALKLSETYEAIGSAAAAEGRVNTTIAAIKDGATIDSFADVESAIAAAEVAYKTADEKVLSDANAYTDAEAAKVKATADQGVADAAAAKAAADAAQGDIDALAEKVGAVPEGSTVMGVIQNIQENAYDDTAVKNLIQGNTDRIATIEGDYLKEADKTELSGLISAEKERAEGIEAGLRTDVDKNAADIAKLTTDVDTKIAAAIEAENLSQYATDTDLAGVKDNLQNQINTIMNNPDTEGVINSIAEFTQYIEDHGELAEGFRADIDALKTKVDTGDKTVSAYVADAVAALSIGDYAKASELLAAVARIETLEGKAHEHANAAELAKVAEGDVAKWNAAEQNAKDYADGLNGAMDNRVQVVEGKAHEHKNLALLETYTQTEADLADAVVKKHEHANKTVIDGVTAEKVTAWDSAEQNAKDYADGLNMTMAARVKAVEDGKANDADLAAVAKSGDIADLIQSGTLILDCGTSAI